VVSHTAGVTASADRVLHLSKDGVRGG